MSVGIFIRRYTDSHVEAVLMDKGIIIGAEHEAATRANLPFVMFRHATSVSRMLIIIFALPGIDIELVEVSLIFTSYITLSS